MRIGKLFMVNFLIVIIVLSIVSFVSAKHAWWHPWGEEPQEAPFEASVLLANAPPTIQYIFPVTDVDNSNVAIPASISGEVQPQAGTTVYAVVKFAVEDPNGVIDLPATPTVITFGSPTAAVGEVAVRVTTPQNGIKCPPAPGTACENRDATTANRPTGVTATCTSVDCTVDTQCNTGPQTGNKANQRMYTCYVQMQYYDEPTVGAGGTANDLWSFSLYIEDAVSGNANQPVPDTSGEMVTAYPARPFAEFYLWYRTVTSMDIFPATERLLFTGLSVTATDTAGDDDNAGDTGGGLTLRNIGNVQVNTLDITPQNLHGVNNGPASVLLATAFSVGTAAGAANAGACDVAAGGGTVPFDGTALTGGTILPNFARSVTYSGQATGNTNDLFFCVWPAVNTGYLTGSTDSSYRATGGTPPYAAGQNWEVVINS